jgi:hypothetical protein
MRTVTIAVVAGLVAWSGAASARTFNVVSGGSVRVAQAYSLNPDCTPIGKPAIRMTQPPQHGRVTIRSARIYPAFPASNPRIVCNTHRVPALEGVYIADRGYVGTDSSSFEIIYGSGNYRQYTVSITVR